MDSFDAFPVVRQNHSLSSRTTIEAIKNLTLAEEYLADHFRYFPVMPGVFMLEALTQTSAWLIRATDQFSHSMVTLAEARTSNTPTFLVRNATAHELRTDRSWTARIQVQSPRFARRNGLCERSFGADALQLSRSKPLHAPRDRRLVAQLKQWFQMLYSGPPLPVVNSRGCHGQQVANYRRAHKLR